MPPAERLLLYRSFVGIVQTRDTWKREVFKVFFYLFMENLLKKNRSITNKFSAPLSVLWGHWIVGVVSDNLYFVG